MSEQFKNTTLSEQFKNTTLSEQFKNNKFHTVGTVQKFNWKIVERGKIDTPNTQMHDLICISSIHHSAKLIAYVISLIKKILFNFQLNWMIECVSIGFDVELYPLWSIYSNSSHLQWLSGSSIWQRTIQVNFGQNWPCGFKKDFCNSLR